MNRTLSELALACDGELKGADAAFAGVVIDTRKLSGGDLFVALGGEHTDGHEFLGAAAAAGAAGALVSQDRAATLPLVQVPNVEQALSAAARQVGRNEDIAIRADGTGVYIATHLGQRQYAG